MNDSLTPATPVLAVLPASGSELAPPSVLPLPTQRSCQDGATRRKNGLAVREAGTPVRRAAKAHFRFDLTRQAAFLAAIPDAKGNLRKAAEIAGSSYLTVYDHMMSDPVFALDVRKAKAQLSQTLVEVSYDRALQPSGTIDRWKLLPSWNPLEYGQTPTVQVNVNHAQLAFGDGSAAFPPQQVVIEAQTE